MGCAPSRSRGVPIVVREPPKGGGINGLVPRPTSGPRDRVTSSQSPEVSSASETSVKENHRNDPIIEAKENTLPEGKPVAFDVTLDNNNNKNLSFNKEKLPQHLKTRLAPLENAPKLTADMLAQRQNQVEQNRLKEMEKKKEVSRQSSRLRTRLLQAREFDKLQSQEREIDDKQLSAGKNRETRLQVQQDKKRLREERAKRVKERAEQMKQAKDSDLGFELEKDEAFNEDDTDSWLGDDDDPRDLKTDMAERLFTSSDGTERVTSGTERVTSGTDRVYSGRESPSKPFNRRTSAELKARMSAGTTDSFDFAFQRPPPAPKPEPASDDFFDS